ncbi:hypothetical protein [Roseovarius aestuariivivens]|uniref:hypothetical protein n=1 Tax=Roseovarius aestuariivivens TaxID=1888910 RepID=UPI00315A1665
MNHARRVHDLPQSPTMEIEWFDKKPNGTMIEDLGAWLDETEVSQNPIHKVF